MAEAGPRFHAILAIARRRPRRKKPQENRNPMTPEERFQRIEQALQYTSESQAQHTDRLDRLDAEIEKHNGAIRDLITVSRTLLSSIQETGLNHQRDHDRVMAEIEKLREAQSATDEKLNLLIEIVDRIIRRNGANEK
jgi:hypothetical protein